MKDPITGVILGVEPAEIEVLGEALRATNALAELDLQGSKMGPSLASMLSRFMRSTSGAGLTKLNVSDCALGIDGMPPLTEALESHKALTELDLSNTSVSGNKEDLKKSIPGLK